MLTLRKAAICLLSAASLTLASASLARASEQAFIIPPPASMPAPNASLKKLVVAGGCFWGVQGVYQHTKGVLNAVSGYAGDEAANANYQAVSHGLTKHAEAVEITYDPAQVSLGELMHIFFSVVHDPTQLDRQGPDQGPHYRSSVFTADASEQQAVKDYIAQLNKTRVYSGEIVTRIEPLTKFYPAEKYHQDYMTLHPTQPYIAFNDLPKVDNLKKVFPGKYREKPVLVSDAKATQ